MQGIPITFVSILIYFIKLNFFLYDSFGSLSMSPANVRRVRFTLSMFTKRDINDEE